jgi:hypothetical protein
VPTAHADFDRVAKQLRGALDTAGVELKMRQPTGTRGDADGPKGRRSGSRLPVGPVGVQAVCGSIDYVRETVKELVGAVRSGEVYVEK